MKNPILPQYLYKYFPDFVAMPPKVPFVQTGNMVRFSQSSAFNDPFESLPIWSLDDMTDEIVNLLMIGDTAFSDSLPYSKRRKFKSRKMHMIKQMARNHPETLKTLLSVVANRVSSNSVGVLSLSSSFESPPMWAHYSNNHSGFCLGLDTSHPFFKPSKGNVVYQVEYVTKRPVVGVAKALDPCAFDAMYQFKDARWAYEDEYRLVRPLATAAKQSGLDQRKIPICLFRLPTECVSRIIVGLHASKALKDIIMSWAETHRHVEVFDSTVSAEGYAMNIVPTSPRNH